MQPQPKPIHSFSVNDGEGPPSIVEFRGINATTVAKPKLLPKVNGGRIRFILGKCLIGESALLIAKSVVQLLELWSPVVLQRSKPRFRFARFDLLDRFLDKQVEIRVVFGGQQRSLSNDSLASSRFVLDALCRGGRFVPAWRSRGFRVHRFAFHRTPIIRTSSVAGRRACTLRPKTQKPKTQKKPTPIL